MESCVQRRKSAGALEHLCLCRSKLHSRCYSVPSSQFTQLSSLGPSPQPRQAYSHSITNLTPQNLNRNRCPLPAAHTHRTLAALTLTSHVHACYRSSTPLSQSPHRTTGPVFVSALGAHGPRQRSRWGGLLGGPLSSGPVSVSRTRASFTLSGRRELQAPEGIQGARIRGYINW